MADDFLDYPKGRIAVGAGDLHDAVDINLAYTDGEKVVHTLRNHAAGSTSGGRSVTLTYKSALSEKGYERNYMKHYYKRQVLQFRVKVPGKTHTVLGRLSEPNIVSNVDGNIEFTVKVVGKDPEASGN